MDRKIYVAYGSNMDERQMAFRCPDSKLLGTGNLLNWRLMFKGEMPYSYATIEEWDGFFVPVVIWEISSADEKRLDRYEGYPKFYLKRDVEIETSDGEKLQGMVYVMSGEQRLNPPCDHYYAVIYDAYRRFGIDLAILKDALAFSDRNNRFSNFARQSVGDNNS